MREPHPTHGLVQGHSLYGIASLSFVAGGLRTVVDECAKVGKTADARDKLFISYVGEFDRCPSKALRDETPVLGAAVASLATAVADLSDVLPQLPSCGSSVALLAGPASGPHLRSKPAGDVWRPSSLTAVGLQGKSAQGAIENVAAAVGEENGADFTSADSLMQAARVSILEARAALK